MACASPAQANQANQDDLGNYGTAMGNHAIYETSKRKKSTLFELVELLADERPRLMGVRHEVCNNQCVAIAAVVWQPSGIVTHYVTDFGLMSMYASLDFCEAAIRAAVKYPTAMQEVQASPDAVQRVAQSLDALDCLLKDTPWKVMLADALRNCYHEIGAASLAYHLVLRTVDPLTVQQQVPAGCQAILKAVQAWLDKCSQTS